MKYVVLSPDAGSLPIILSINPDSAGQGGGITIVGKNFGETPGVAWFHAPDGRIVPADVSGKPKECEDSGGWWTDTSITVKVPRVQDVNDFDGDKNKNEALV